MSVDDPYLVARAAGKLLELGDKMFVKHMALHSRAICRLSPAFGANNISDTFDISAPNIPARDLQQLTYGQGISIKIGARSFSFVAKSRPQTQMQEFDSIKTLIKTIKFHAAEHLSAQDFAKEVQDDFNSLCLCSWKEFNISISDYNMPPGGVSMVGELGFHSVEHSRFEHPIVDMILG